MKVIDKPKYNWFIDATIFLGFLVAMFSDFTGHAVHEWLGLAVILLSGYHLLVHWKWVKGISGQFFGRLKGQTRLTFSVDACLCIGFLVIGITGLVTSSWLNLPLDNYLYWRDVHVFASIVTLVLVALKIALHWRWIIIVASRGLFSSPASRSTLATQPVSATPTLGRREFLRLMGFVGVTTLVAGGTALTELSFWQSPITADTPEPEPSSTVEAQSVATATAPPTSTASKPKATSTVSRSTSTSQVTSTPRLTATPTPTSTPKSSTSTNGGSTGTCTQSCSKRCSYPGKCRRYVDTNGNKKCDLGEC